MKNLILIARVAGLVIASTGALFANDIANVKPAAPSVKSNSPHAVSAVAKEASSLHLMPPLPKRSLPVDAGRKQGAANIGGSSMASGHKAGILNGKEIKRRP
jgi:hypothetical protein